MTFEEISKLCSDKELFERVVSHNKVTSDEASRISDAFSVVFKKRVANACVNCIGDALTELVYIYTKNPEQMKKQVETKYLLKAGVLIRMKYGESKMYSNANLTDEVAEKYIIEAEPQTEMGFASRLDDFQKKPEDIVKKVEEKISAIRKEKEEAAMQAMNAGTIELDNDASGNKEETTETKEEPTTAKIK